MSTMADISYCCRSQITVPDIVNRSVAEQFCRAEGRDRTHCSNWLTCCSEARACCDRQQQQQQMAASRHRNDTTRYCQRTWDGFSCWDDTPAGTDSAVPCPSFMWQSLRSRTTSWTWTFSFISIHSFIIFISFGYIFHQSHTYCMFVCCMPNY